MPKKPSSPNAAENRMPDIGTLGEDLVVEWLQQQGWEILHRRWRTRWGEIDAIASLAAAEIAFVEVKTRRQRNWDAGGLLAITAQKQAKLQKAAGLFLADRPDLADLPCRFDVAIVRYQPLPSRNFVSVPSSPAAIALRQPVRVGDCQLTLIDYIQSAFD